MAIKGLSELLKKHKDGELDDAQFEAELNKALPEDWIPKAKYNEVNEARKLADENLKKANATLDELKGKAGLSDEYKAQIDALKAEAKKAEEAHKATIDGMRRDSAISQALASAKARNAKARTPGREQARPQRRWNAVRSQGTAGGCPEGQWVPFRRVRSWRRRKALLRRKRPDGRRFRRRSEGRDVQRCRTQCS